MASTAEQRLFEVYEAYRSAYRRRAADLKEAKTEQQASAILKQLEALEIIYLKAARQALDANGPNVEAAYKDACDARAAVEDAYEEAKDIADKIRAVAGVVKAVGNLVTKAAGK